MRDLVDKVAVVTGAAHGIGLGLATRFVAEGMRVVLSDVDQPALDAAVGHLRERGGEVIGVRTDVADPRQVESLAEATVAAFGGVHLLCNNAGVGGLQRFTTTSLTTWEWILGVDLWGPIHGIRVFLPLLIEADEAHIVNTASMAGFLHTAYMQPYDVAKAGIVALTESLSAELAIEHPHVGVSVLCPAHTATSIRHDERLAPAGHVPRAIADPGLEERRERINRANEAGMPTSEVAAMVVEAIAEKRVHIFTHPESLQHVRTRLETIVAGAATPSTMR